MMTATVTPVGGAARPLELAEEPTWTLAEQGGFKDATCELKSAIDDVRCAELSLWGPSGPEWFGHVKGIDGRTVTGEGWQARLEDLRRGACYHTDYYGRWGEWASEPAPYLRVPTVSTSSTETSLSVSFSAGWLSGWYRNGHELIFPQTSSGSITLSWTGNGDGIYIGVLKSGLSSGEVLFESIAASGTQTVSFASVTGLVLCAYRPTGVSLGGERTITFTGITVRGTSVATVNDINVVNHVLDACGPLIPARDLSGDTTALTDLWFEADATELEKLAHILKYVDRRFWFEPRLIGGVYRPCACYAPRPTEPRYSLVEDGTSVICDLVGVSTEPLASIVRVLYRDAAGRPRYIDVPDTDPTHFLVHEGITKYAVTSADTNNTALATAQGQRYLMDAGRDQVQGTVALRGAPGGIPACEYLPGELIRLTSRERGVVVSRITSATYKGPYHADLTLDDTPDFEGLIRRMNRQRSASAILHTT
jgi:hypothetical protein